LKRTRIKVCGMTRVDDVVSAVSLGVDALGMILHADSPRTIGLEQAKNLRRFMPAFVNVVGVFVDADIEFIEQYASQIGLDTVQLHGDESADFAASLTRPYIKALRVKNRSQVMAASAEYPNARGLLLDPYVPGKHGGTGQLLEDAHWPTADISQPLILAGGLNPENIAQRMTQLRPFAVDINSGVESSAGNKSAQLMAAAIHQVRLADQGGAAQRPNDQATCAEQH